MFYSGLLCCMCSTTSVNLCIRQTLICYPSVGTAEGCLIAIRSVMNIWKLNVAKPKVRLLRKLCCRFVKQPAHCSYTSTVELC
jgi:hypothetical protein